MSKERHCQGDKLHNILHKIVSHFYHIMDVVSMLSHIHLTNMLHATILPCTAEAKQVLLCNTVSNVQPVLAVKSDNNLSQMQRY